MNAVENEAPVISPDSTFTTGVGTTFVHAVDAFDPDQDELRYSLSVVGDGGLPEGLSFNQISGEMRWDISTDLPQSTFQFLARVEDDFGAFDTHQFTVEVTGTDLEAPSLLFYVQDALTGETVSPGSGNRFSANYGLYILVRCSRQLRYSRN